MIDFIFRTDIKLNLRAIFSHRCINVTTRYQFFFIPILGASAIGTMLEKEQQSIKEQHMMWFLAKKKHLKKSNVSPMEGVMIC